MQEIKQFMAKGFVSQNICQKLKIKHVKKIPSEFQRVFTYTSEATVVVTFTEYSTFTQCTGVVYTKRVFSFKNLPTIYQSYILAKE